MKSVYLPLALTVALGAMSGPAAGEPLPPAPPVEALVQEALAKAPVLAAARAREEAQRRREEPAGALPDPMLEIMIQDAGFPDWTVGDEPMSMIGPQLTQSFPFPGTQGARKAAAAAQTGVRRAETERLRRSIALDVRRACAAVYALDRESEMLDAGRELTDLLSATVSHHVEMGEMDQEAAVKVRLLVSRLEERATNLEAERARHVAELNRLLDRPADSPLGPMTALPDSAPPAGDLDSLAASADAVVGIRAASVHAADRSLRAARAELRPDFRLGGGVGFRGDLDPVVNVRVGVELPIWWGKNQRPLVHAAESELDAAREDLKDAENAARSRATSLRAEWKRADTQVLRYRESFVPQSSLAFDAARSAWLGHRGDFSTVMEDFRMWLDARTGLAAREAERFTAWAELDALTRPAPEGETK